MAPALRMTRSIKEKLPIFFNSRELDQGGSVTTTILLRPEESRAVAVRLPTYYYC